MPFWSTDFGQSTNLNDPKRKFRFVVSFDGIQDPQGGAVLWYAKTVNKPSFQISEQEHKYLNHTFFYPGSVTWQEISVTLVDPVEPDMAATLSDIVQQSGYQIPTTADQRTTMSKAKAANALGSVIITQIDHAGDPLETWTLWNSWIKELKYGDLEYGSDELTELTVTLKYDWARVETEHPSVSKNGTGQQKSFFGV